MNIARTLRTLIVVAVLALSLCAVGGTTSAAGISWERLPDPPDQGVGAERP